MNQPGDAPSSAWARMCARVWAVPRRKWLLGIPLGGLLFFVLGLAFYAGTGKFLEATSTPTFCSNACHEMTAFSVPSWHKSSHYKNPFGVQAACGNCHEPGPAGPMMIRRFQALGEIWGHVTGEIDTQAKFDAQKTRMARHVWAYMKANDSRECRACHNAAAWDLSAQDRSAQKKHEQMQSTGKTCIDCHKGVVHEVPLGADQEP
jgi:cytochrome c-type protein NapC